MTELGWDPAALTRDYGDWREEARACRRDCALFDFSFISRAEVRGARAEELIGRLTRRSLAGLASGGIRYALRERDDGTLVSDLTIWRHGPRHFEVMSGMANDIRDLVSFTGDETRVIDLSADTAILALQGPGALAALGDFGDAGAVAALPYYGFCAARLAGIDCLIGRLGYTGEPGVEIIMPQSARQTLWSRLAGRARPAGFAATDMLRIEAGFVLFTQEFRVPVRAAEIGLGRFAGGGDRPGRLRLVCFTATSRSDAVLWSQDPRSWLPVAPGTLLVTSACQSLAAGQPLGLGYVLASDLASGKRLADPSGVFHDIELGSLPFHDPGKIKPRRAWPQIGP